MPITSKCNSRCVTCNIWKYKDNIDMDPVQLKEVLSDNFFSKVNSVGINGGEPFFNSNFVEIIKSVLTLPKLKGIFIISNCISSDRVLNSLRTIYPLCKQRNVRLHLQISIDGVGNVHNEVRGIKTSFERSLKVIDELKKNKEEYLDEFNLGCTISKYNVDYMSQTREFFACYNVPMYFHLAVPNKRIHNFDDAPFSVLTDSHARQMAKEFFYTMSAESCGLLHKVRYYLIYLYLAGKTNKRMFLCDYLYRDITINEEFDTFLCATASDKVGNLKDGIPSYSDYNKLVDNTKCHCDTCIHYANTPSLLGILTFLKYKLPTRNYINKYKRSI